MLIWVWVWIIWVFGLWVYMGLGLGHISGYGFIYGLGWVYMDLGWVYMVWVGFILVWAKPKGRRLGLYLSINYIIKFGNLHISKI